MNRQRYVEGTLGLVEQGKNVVYDASNLVLQGC